MFAFKQIVKRLLMPPSSILLLLLVGFVLILLRLRRLGRVILAGGILLLYLLSIAPTADSLLGPLESSHAPISPKLLPRTGTLVVLSGGASATPSLPASSRLSQASTRRVLEAVRLYQLMDHPKIVISGGSGNPFVQVSEAVVMRELFRDLGIKDQRMMIEGESRDTFENVRGIQKLRMRRPLILITSAWHMTRALKVFEAAGMKPLPAPCDFRTRVSMLDPLRYVPSTGALAASTAAIHEYLASWWYKITGKL